MEHPGGHFGRGAKTGAVSVGCDSGPENQKPMNPKKGNGPEYGFGFGRRCDWCGLSS